MSNELKILPELETERLSIKLLSLSQLRLWVNNIFTMALNNEKIETVIAETEAENIFFFIFSERLFSYFLSRAISKTRLVLEMALEKPV